MPLPIPCLPRGTKFEVSSALDAGGDSVRMRHELRVGNRRDLRRFRTLNDVRSTLASWRHEYNCERPHSSLAYRTPEEFRQAGYANVESKERFPHLHSLDGCCEIISEQNQNRETPAISG
jgi:Integrase core domain